MHQIIAPSDTPACFEEMCDADTILEVTIELATEEEAQIHSELNQNDIY